MNINLTLIGQSLTFLVFIFFCMKFVWPALIGVMQEREQRIAEGLEAADRADKDLELAQKLILAGSEHCKFMRQIQVWADISTTRYVWSEFDTYKFNTKNSTSTMHRLFNTKDILRIDSFYSEDLNDKVIWYNSNQISESNDIYSVDENTDGTTDYTFEKPDFSFVQLSFFLILDIN